MKKCFWLMCGLLLSLSCASLQDPVDNSLLTEITPTEKQSIEAIKNNIINKKTEKDTAEKNVEISGQLIQISKSRIQLIEAQRDYLLKQEKYYILIGNNSKLSGVRLQIKKSDDLLLQEFENQRFCSAKKNSDITAFAVKEAELSVLVSSLDLENAKIAREYQIRRYGKDYKKLIDVKKFEGYYNAQQDNLNKKKQEYEKNISEEKKASEKLKATGYEAQL
jgi:hypothetical protein